MNENNKMNFKEMGLEETRIGSEPSEITNLHTEKTIVNIRVLQRVNESHCSLTRPLTRYFAVALLTWQHQALTLRHTSDGEKGAGLDPVEKGGHSYRFLKPNQHSFSC
jgi:hypothetical protein